MRIKIILVVILFLGFNENCAAEEIKINNEFKQALLRRMPEIDLDSDNIITTEEAERVSRINLVNSGLRNIEGLSCFINLKELMLTRNELEKLSIKGLLKLEVIYCISNKLIHLELDNLPLLTELYIGHNSLTNLNVNHLGSLEVLNCSDNKIKELDVSKLKNLTFLSIVSNQIKYIDISHNIILKTFQFNYNPIQEMDISKNSNLIFDGKFSWDQSIKLIATKFQMELIKKNIEEENQNPPLIIEEKLASSENYALIDSIVILCNYKEKFNSIRTNRVQYFAKKHDLIPDKIKSIETLINYSIVKPDILRGGYVQYERTELFSIKKYFESMTKKELESSNVKYESIVLQNFQHIIDSEIKRVIGQ